MPLSGWRGPEPSAAGEVVPSTKLPNFRTEMTVVILEAAPSFGAGGALPGLGRGHGDEVPGCESAVGG